MKNTVQRITALAFAFLFMTGLTPAQADNPEFTLIIKDHQFSPSELKIPANQKVKLVIENQDPTPEEFESHDLHREKIINGHSKGTVFIGPLKPGSYKFFGEFNQATAQGVVIAEG